MTLKQFIKANESKLIDIIQAMLSGGTDEKEIVNWVIEVARDAGVTGL